jgi:pimeloyl-ACP methyl ester carboxylesterase
MLRTFFKATQLDQDRARRINTPTLVVTGELSPAIYRAMSQALVSCLPHSQFRTLAGTSHGLHLENPDGFSAAAVDFLRRNEITASKST